MAQASDLRPDDMESGRSALKEDHAPTYGSSHHAGVAGPEPGPWPFYIPRVRTFNSLRFRDFRLLWLGQGGNSMGQWMDQVARSWLVYQITGSAVDLGLVSAMRGVPMLFFSIIAGVVADRGDRKTQLVIAQVTNVILNLAVATLVLIGRIEVWHIYVSALMAGAAMAFQQPARQSLVLDLVRREDLSNAVAINAAIFNLMRSIGPAMAGATIAIVGVTGSYYIQAAVYAWATLWTVQMKVPNNRASHETVKSKQIDLQPAPAEDGKTRPVPPEQDNVTADRQTGRMSRANDSFFGSLKEGFQYVFRNSLILSLMFLALAPTLLGMPFASLMPIFALDVLHGTSVEQGMLLSSVGIGALIGALAIASIGSFRRKGMLLLAGATMFGLSLIAFSQSGSMPLAMFFLLIVGISNASYGSQNQTIIQSLAPANLRGRVMSIYMLNQGLMPLGALLAGFLAHWLGGPWAVTIMGAGCTAVALGVAVIRPEIREIDI